MQDYPHVRGVSDNKASYMLYAYQTYDPNKIGHNKWKCLTSHETKDEALRQGSVVFESNLYQKIEVKEKAYDSQKRRHILKTHHVWQYDAHQQQGFMLKWKKAIYWGMALVVLLAVVLFILLR